MTGRNLLLLKSFNTRFLAFITFFRQLAPSIPNIILIEDGLDFCIGSGDPQLPLMIFKMSTDNHKADIYKENDELLSKGVILNEVGRIVNQMKDKKMKIDTNDIKKIDDGIGELQHVWSGITKIKKKVIWQKLQILVKLGEKINVS